MSEQKRILRMAGLNDDILKNHSRDKLNEMAIKKWKWNDLEDKFENIDISAREMSKHIIIDWMNRTGYWQDEEDLWGVDKMTSKEKSAVEQHRRKFVDRIYKMLKPKKL